VRLTSSANETERALRATADAHERRFSTLTERSPIPTLLSEQGMRLAHVNDAFCALVDIQAEELLGTGWMSTVHPDDLEAVIEQATAVLGGGEDHALVATFPAAIPAGWRRIGVVVGGPPRVLVDGAEETCAAGWQSF